MRIKNRYLLVAALAATQAVCLGWGLVAFSGWMSGAIRETVHKQILADNVQTARQMTAMIREMQAGDIRRDLAEWNRMQSVVREIRLPNDGYVCMIDSKDGQLLCHPALKERPEFKNGDFRVQAPSPEEPPRVTGGIFGEGDQLEIIAAAEVPEMRARVMVHQLGRGVDRAIAEIMAPIRPLGIGVALGMIASSTIALLFVLRVYDNRLARINEHLEDRVDQRTRSLRKTRDAVIFGLAKLAESRDTDTGEHLERIRTYVTLLAEQLREDGIQLSEREINDLALASSLHDIGKVGIADNVLLKPGRLDPEEREHMEQHAVIGGECLEAIGDRLGEDDFLQVAKDIAYGHHERWDGAGYPAGVRGEQIPLSARIVALADVYDALRSRRPYKEPMPHEKAKGILLEGRGAHFDPVVVEAFLACEERFIEVSERSNQASQRDHAGTEAVSEEEPLALA